MKTQLGIDFDYIESELIAYLVSEVYLQSSNHISHLQLEFLNLHQEASYIQLSIKNRFDYQYKKVLI